jgi:hypothetical protein
MSDPTTPNDDEVTYSTPSISGRLTRRRALECLFALGAASALVPLTVMAAPIAPVLPPLPRLVSPPVDREAAFDAAWDALLAIIDDVFRVQHKDGLDAALQLVADRSDATRAHIQATFGEAGRQAVREARDLLRDCADSIPTIA